MKFSSTCRCSENCPTKVINLPNTTQSICLKRRQVLVQYRMCFDGRWDRWSKTFQCEPQQCLFEHSVARHLRVHDDAGRVGGRNVRCLRSAGCGGSRCGSRVAGSVRRLGQPWTAFDCLWYDTAAGVKADGNAVLRPAISAIWRSRASKSAFSMETHVSIPEDSFIHGNAKFQPCPSYPVAFRMLHILLLSPTSWKNIIATELLNYCSQSAFGQETQGPAAKLKRTKPIMRSFSHVSHCLFYNIILGLF